jgi:hypothetical protein
LYLVSARRLTSLRNPAHWQPASISAARGCHISAALEPQAAAKSNAVDRHEHLKIALTPAAVRTAIIRFGAGKIAYLVAIRGHPAKRSRLAPGQRAGRRLLRLRTHACARPCGNRPAVVTAADSAASAASFMASASLGQAIAELASASQEQGALFRVGGRHASKTSKQGSHSGAHEMWLARVSPPLRESLQSRSC